VAENYLTQISKPYSKRAELELLRAQMDLERCSFLPTWREAGEFVLPRRPRFVTTDTDRGGRRTHRIIDSTATLSARTLRSGMMSGVTSPARPWFQLTTSDPNMSEDSEVKDWLYLVTQRMTTVFLKSNLYNVLPIIYGDIGVFGTGCVLMEEDLEDVLRFYPFPIGSYMIANDEKLRVNVFLREFRMTVRQIVRKFGFDHLTGVIDWTNISSAVRTLWENKQPEVWVDVKHCIRPNPDYDPRKLHSKHKKYSSDYYEAGFYSNGVVSDDFNGLFLSQKGYDYFPVLAPRWEVTGEDVYGTSCPGIDAMGDIKQLQLGEKRGMQAIEKMVNPPMIAPTSMRNQKTSILPGDVSYSDAPQATGFRPAQEVNPRIAELAQKQSEIRQRIQRCFFEDLFLMLSESDRREITAREVDERHEEKLLALGPVLEQLNQDLLDPLIANSFLIMLRHDRLIPPAPKKLHGQALSVEYLSIMAQAQKLIGIEGIERFATFAQGVIQVNPSAQDKVDSDGMLEKYGDMVSLPPGIVRSDDQVQAIRAQKAKAAQQQQQQAAMAQAAQTAQTLGNTPTDGNNALSQLMDQAKAGQLTPNQ
jgi:hypothetical protein